MAQHVHNKELARQIGARIKKQRMAAGMHVKQLAETIGVSRNTITNYENGSTTPGSSDIILVAKAVGCDLLELLSDAGTESKPRFAFRALKAHKRNPRLIVAAKKFFKAYCEIEEITQTKLVSKLPGFSPKKEISERQIEVMANSLRRSCGIADSGPESITHVIEGLGVRCLFFHYEEGIDGLSARNDAMTMILLRHQERGIERVIFSAAHELGHLVLHPELFTGKAIKDEKYYELEANMFAGYFLAPTDDLLTIWEREGLASLPPVYALIHLKKVFKVSFWCLFERARQEQLLHVKYGTLINQLKKILGIVGKARMKELEPAPMHAHDVWQSTRFCRLVRSAFLQDLIGISKVAEFMQITVDRAKEITAQWMVPDSELVG